MSSARAFASASSPHGNQSTGLAACWSRYGLVSLREPVHALYGNGVTLPGGTVTFLFTDIEGSTRLLQELGDDYGQVVADHRRLLREVFVRAPAGTRSTRRATRSSTRSRARVTRSRAAVAGQRALAGHEWPRGARGARAHGPAHRRADASATRATSASTSSVPRGSARPGTAARSCSRRRRARCSATSCPSGVTVRDLGAAAAEGRPARARLRARAGGVGAASSRR